MNEDEDEDEREKDVMIPCKYVMNVSCPLHSRCTLKNDLNYFANKSKDKDDTTLSCQIGHRESQCCGLMRARVDR